MDNIYMKIIIYIIENTIESFEITQHYLFIVTS